MAAGTLIIDNLESSTGAVNRDTADLINGACTAWVNLNGTGTVAIRDSFNVSSITDNGVGDYSANFATAMTNANYATIGYLIATASAGDSSSQVSYSTALTRVYAANSVGTLIDVATVHIITFGGQ